MSVAKTTATKSLKADAREKLWRLGVLAFKLHAAQKEIYDLYHNTDKKIAVWLLSRRTGKTHALCLLAVEACLRKPNSIVKFVYPTKKQVNDIVRPIFRTVLEDCPTDLLPTFNTQDYIYYFPNGSEIQLAGSNSGHAEKLRGSNATAAFVDEAGSCTDLDNIVKSILLPTTLITGGKIILAGTPSADTDHEYHKFIEDAELKGSLIKKTIYENPMLTKKQIDEAVEEMGGVDSDKFKREYLCLIEKDPTRSVVPEFTPELESEIVKEWQKPPHYDMYVSMDLGFQDLTAILYGYYDFRHNRVIIEDESIIDFKVKDVTIETLVKAVRDTEQKRFFNHLTNELKKPHKRVSDIEYIVTKEISKISNYEINFEAITRDDVAAKVNFLREKLKKREVIINPRCTTLIKHLRNVKWKNSEKSIFARSPDDSHYDAVAALIYMIQYIDYRKNPYPSHYGIEQKDLFGNFILNKDKTFKAQEDRQAIYRKIFNIKKKV